MKKKAQMTEQPRILLMVLTLILVPAFLFAAGGQEKSDATKNYTFRFGTIQPADSPVGLGAAKFAELVGEKTNGQVKIEVYPASQLGNEKDLMDGVEMGTLEFAMGGIAEWAKRYKPIMIFEGPFVFRNREHLLKTYESEVGRQILKGLTDATNAQSLTMLYYGTRHVTTGKIAVRTPADLNGVKLRCPDQPLYVQVTKAMGATPAPMAFSEVYLALQQGVVDGQENPAATIATMKFYEVQKYLIKTGHIIAGVQIFTNKKLMDSLPENLRTEIISAAREAGQWANSNSFQIEDQFLNDLGGKYGMEIIEPDRQAFIDAAQPLLADYENQWGAGLLEKVRGVK